MFACDCIEMALMSMLARNNTDERRGFCSLGLVVFPSRLLGTAEVDAPAFRGGNFSLRVWLV